VLNTEKEAASLQSSCVCEMTEEKENCPEPSKLLGREEGLPVPIINIAGTKQPWFPTPFLDLMG